MLKWRPHFDLGDDLQDRQQQQDNLVIVVRISSNCSSSGNLFMNSHEWLTSVPLGGICLNSHTSEAEVIIGYLLTNEGHSSESVIDPPQEDSVYSHNKVRLGKDGLL